MENQSPKSEIEEVVTATKAGLSRRLYATVFVFLIAISAFVWLLTTSAQIYSLDQRKQSLQTTNEKLDEDLKRKVAEKEEIELRVSEAKRYLANLKKEIEKHPETPQEIQNDAKAAEQALGSGTTTNRVRSKSSVYIYAPIAANKAQKDYLAALDTALMGNGFAIAPLKWIGRTGYHPPTVQVRYFRNEDQPAAQAVLAFLSAEQFGDAKLLPWMNEWPYQNRVEIWLTENSIKDRRADSFGWVYVGEYNRNKASWVQKHLVIDDRLPEVGTTYRIGANALFVVPVPTEDKSRATGELTRDKQVKVLGLIVDKTGFVWVRIK